MNFFKNIAEKLGLIPEDRTAKIIQERLEIMKTMSSNLAKIGFTEDEINEVLGIIVQSEVEIQEQKDLLIGTNINNDDVNSTMKPIFDEIKRIQLKAASDIRAKIAEIKAKKGI